MTALSIRRMNETMVFKEQIMDAYLKSLKPASLAIHYWHVERKAKKGKNKWIFVGRFFCTKQDMANTWLKFYRDGNHRLVHMMSYGSKA